jgi:hypothetical protein
MSPPIFEKAPELEYRRRSWWGRLVRRPRTVVGIVVAVVLATVFAVRVTQQLRAHNVARPNSPLVKR